MKKIAVSTLLLAAMVICTTGSTFAAGTSKVKPNTQIGGGGASTYPGTSISAQPGDILVTNSTSSSGLTGHAGIVVDYSGDVASIAGIGYHPAIMSMSSWFSSYPNEDIIRYGVSAGQSAANWATSYVNTYPNAGYAFEDLSLYTNTTYCSKIVWDSYYFGAGVTLPDEYSTAWGGGGMMVSMPADFYRGLASDSIYSNFTWS